MNIKTNKKERVQRKESTTYRPPLTIQFSTKYKWSFLFPLSKFFLFYIFKPPPVAPSFFGPSSSPWLLPHYPFLTFSRTGKVRLQFLSLSPVSVSCSISLSLSLSLFAYSFCRARQKKRKIYKMQISEQEAGGTERKDRATVKWSGGGNGVGLPSFGWTFLGG